ncbi:protein LAZY 1 isoform X1 [Gossypium hirsutum]|uniref:Protein LAZY 1 isoform X1 n=1 Tax=Gossypium hirsutum TaxID=3635 RepID=A0A1U8PCE5_GOSHI|nr:protein LAZY 1-like isoform X1 [Gossypium hirsutum]XP_040968473.1 protein LAZY 1-like isoform X1 [Gossypium hirsutum]XP_040968474.1 protein LAZY 1-like isoform X1 [Gossypium hirsutum]XP_040968475.1 protein LAZY 1-like isoform X1 [Gossypium hirsutum]XP_040968476.1 protein LAZY 1-like isoform X1 [Gossypium hirsutum]XP_040968477.1 protein LAZY 1-like isoform X1 [Gossypium hirsutum]
MKLLGWMQHKLRPSNIEPFKDFTIGNYCTCLLAHSSLGDNQGYEYGSRDSTLSQQEMENSITEFQGKGGEDNFGDETSNVISELFQGFLTIGTLGSQQIMSEPETPTFKVSLDNITEDETEVTENDLKLINDELGRFLEAEAEEHGSNESSGRNSQVSTITLSGKAIQAAASVEECGKTILCPLQGYLFGSSVELPEPRFEVKKEKASLAELFYRTKVAEEYNNNPMEKSGKEDTQTKQTTKPVKHLIKKILKKFHASSGKEETNSFSTKKKLQKVIKLFHRKIHPENSIAERESKMNNAPYSDNDYTGGDNMRFPQGSRSKAGLGNNKKTISKLPQYGLTGCTAATENGEHWIKTDADCKYNAHTTK